jgi:GT2 family glycosyltransferase
LKTIDIFIITFYSDLNVLGKVLQRLSEAVSVCSNAVFRVTLIDNSHGRDQGSTLGQSYFDDLKELVSKSSLAIDLHQSPSNLGFGRANNLAFELSSQNTPSADYILVLNPDAFLGINALSKALNVLNEKPDLGLLLPRFLSEAGDDLYLSKQYPSIGMLFLRGFAPGWLRKIFKSSVDAYDLKHLPADKQHFEAVVGSGACFLMRTNIWQKLKGFDPCFFLYFEDFDLTYRAMQITQVVYMPSVEVVHLGGHTAKKGLTHIKYFIRSAWQFFNKNGWKFFA